MRACLLPVFGDLAPNQREAVMVLPVPVAQLQNPVGPRSNLAQANPLQSGGAQGLGLLAKQQMARTQAIGASVREPVPARAHQP
jgi:hypothetical protein